MVANLNDGGNDNVMFRGVHNDVLWFTGTGGLYSYDDGQVMRLTNLPSVSNLVFHEGCLYFSANNLAEQSKLHQYCGGDTLWQRSNIREDGTDQLSNFAVLEGNLYFVAFPVAGRSKLFRYEPANNKIVQITNINPSGSDGITQVRAFGDRLLFRGAAPALHMYSYRPSSHTLERLTSEGMISMHFIADRALVLLRTAGGGRKLYSYMPGRTPAFVQVADTQGDPAQDDIPITGIEAWSYAGHTFLSAETPDGVQLFLYDPSIERLHRVLSREVKALAEYHGAMFVSVLEDNGHRNVYRFTVEDGE